MRQRLLSDGEIDAGESSSLSSCFDQAIAPAQSCERNGRFRRKLPLQLRADALRKNLQICHRSMR